ncbi:hypothetical protein DENSPDRAFT_849273, partial [Dentipellis sp. KUC8613]
VAATKKRSKGDADLSDEVEEIPPPKKSRNAASKKNNKKAQAAAEKEEEVRVRGITLKMMEAEGKQQASDDSDNRDKDSGDHQDNDANDVTVESHADLDNEEEELLRDLRTPRTKEKRSDDASGSESEEDDEEDDEEEDIEEDKGYDNSSEDEGQEDSDVEEESQEENNIGQGNASCSRNSAFQGTPLVECRQYTKQNSRENNSTTPVKTTTWITRDLTKAFGPATARLALKSREQLRVMVSTEDGFPLSTVGQDTFVWDAMRRVVAKDRDSTLRGELKELEKGLKALAGKSNEQETERLERVTTFIWAGVAQMRGQIKDEAFRACERYFAFETLLFNNTSEVKDKVEWLLSEDGGPLVFTFGGIDMKAKAYDETQVLGLPIVAIIIGKMFYGKQANASKAAYSGIYHSLPVRLIALVFVAIECCITAFRNGIRKDVQFTDSAFQMQYQYYWEMLDDFKEKMPVFWETFIVDLRRKIRMLSGKEVKERIYDKNTQKRIDFTALEAAAIAKKGVQVEVAEEVREVGGGGAGEGSTGDRDAREEEEVEVGTQESSGLPVLPGSG